MGLSICDSQSPAGPLIRGLCCYVSCVNCSGRFESVIMCHTIWKGAIVGCLSKTLFQHSMKTNKIMGRTEGTGMNPVMAVMPIIRLIVWL